MEKTEWSGVVSCRVVCRVFVGERKGEKQREGSKHSRSSDEGGVIQWMDE